MSRSYSRNKIKVPMPLMIVFLALFAVSLVFFFIARSLPAETEEENVLLNYEHQGSFDYTIYLKPSYLFGPPPTEETENPKYPAEIIDDIEFTYRYSPLQPATEVVDIDGILSNENIWEKRVKVLPYTRQSGEFIVRFDLDIDEIEEMYDEIEEEIGIGSSPHVYTLEVHITTANNQDFVHSLPVQLGSTLIEIPADLTHTDVWGSGEFSYEISLKDNAIWGESAVLVPPEPPETASPWVTLKPGDIIFFNLIDRMDMSYSYLFRSDQPAENVVSDMQIKVVIEAVSGGMEEDSETVLWSKEYPLLTTTGKGGKVETDFPLDYLYYSDMIDTIRSETGSSGSSNLAIVATVHTKADTAAGRIDETFIQTLTGNMSGGIMEWNEELLQTRPNVIATTSVVPNTETYMGLSVSEAGVVSAVIAGFLFLASLALVIMYFVYRPEQLATADTFARQIGKKYQQRIAEASGQLSTQGDKIIDLASMEDMIKVSDELAKPIIHQQSPAGNKAHSYFISEGNTLYRFTVTGERTPEAPAEPPYRSEVRRVISEAIEDFKNRNSAPENKEPPE